MKIFTSLIILMALLPVTTSAANKSTLKIIINEPVTMMDLGILRLNSSLSRQKMPGLRGATLNASYNAKKRTIDIKVSKPVKKATKSQCKKIINSTKKIFLKPFGKKKVSNIYKYFQHEGTPYTLRIDWNDLSNHVVITGIALTKKNYQDSVYCQSRLMSKQIRY